MELSEVALDTDTTVHTLFGNQMGGRKGYNPNSTVKKSHQPILTFLAETREYVGGALRTGHRPDGKQIADHFRSVAAGLPPDEARSLRQAHGGRPSSCFTDRFPTVAILSTG